MTHAAPIGIKKEHLIPVADLSEDRLEKAISELVEHNLIEQGRIENGVFVVGEGERYRQKPGVEEKVLRDILKM